MALWWMILSYCWFFICEQTQGHKAGFWTFNDSDFPFFHTRASSFSDQTAGRYKSVLWGQSGIRMWGVWRWCPCKMVNSFPEVCPFFFGCVGSLLLHAGFLYLRRAGTTLHCGVRASHGGGFSCWGARALGAQTSVVVACRLSSCGSQPLERRLNSCGARA